MLAKMEGGEQEDFLDEEYDTVDTPFFDFDSWVEDLLLND